MRALIFTQNTLKDAVPRILGIAKPLFKILPQFTQKTANFGADF